MWESLIAIASGANTLWELYRNISAIVRGDEGSTEQYLKRISTELGGLRLEVERLSEHILYTPTLKGVRDLNLEFHPIRDLREVKEYLDPIQKGLEQDIVSSGMILTPNRLLQAMRKSPWDVLYNIRPVHYAEPSTDPSSVPVLFQDRGVAYLGWTKRGALSGMFDCEYNELWLPGFKQSKAQLVKPKPPDRADIRIQFDGAWFLIDAEVQVFLDNTHLGVGSLIKGFTFNHSTSLGRKQVELKTKALGFSSTKVYNIQLLESGQYSLVLKYNRFWGNFDDSYTLLGPV